MPSYLDLGLIVVVLISALLAMLRGFTREFLAIASWAAAAISAYFFFPLLLPYITPHIEKPLWAQAIAVTLVFLIALIVVSIITIKVSDVIIDSKVGALDRSLGFIFGMGRGFLLCVIAFIFYAWLTGGKKEEEWFKTARFRPILQTSADEIIGMFPENVAETLLAKLKTLKTPNGGAAEEAPADTDVDIKPAPPAPAPKPDPGKHT